MSPPRWFRIVSTSSAVLPVERSPMISSRWPRPTFVIASMALTPVWSGSFTGWRSTTPGALNSSGRRSSVSIGGPPSIGLPSGSTMRPTKASPTGTLATRPVRFAESPSLIRSQSPKSAAPTLSSSRLNASPITPCSSSSISIATAFSRPYMRAMPSPTCRTVPTSARSVSTSNSSIRCLRIEVISSGRSFKSSPSPLSSRCSEPAMQAVQASADARVDAQRAHLQDDAADQVGVHLARGLDGSPGRLLNLFHDLAELRVRQLDGRGQLERELAGLGGHHPLQLAPHLLQLGSAAALREDHEEVAHQLVGAAQDLLQHREVEALNSFLDETPVVLVVENLARHLLGRDQAQLRDLGADLLQRPLRLGLDLAPRVLEPSLPIGLGLLLHP